MDDTPVWVELHTCGQRFHLECKTKNYWILNLDACDFECFEYKTTKTDKQYISFFAILILINA